MEGDGVTLSAMTTAISSFIQDVATKTYRGTVQKSEFEEMTKAGFNMLAREGQFISIVLLGDMPFGEFTKANLRALQEDLENTFHDGYKRLFMVASRNFSRAGRAYNRKTRDYSSKPG